MTVTRLLCRRCRLLVLTLIAWRLAAAGASAQAPDQPPGTPSLAAVESRVPIGGLIEVTDSTGDTIKGRLAAATDAAVQLYVRGELRSVAASGVHRVQWRQPDSPLTGVLIGAAIGAIPGVYWLIADPNECTGMCPEEYAAIAIGAGIGGLIDFAIARKVTVYAAAPAGSGAKRVTVGPLVSADRRGVRVGLRF
jgi:hypothetical protein